MYDEAGHLIGEYDGSGGLIQETVWLGDLPVATLRPGSPVEINYVHSDHLGAPVRVTRASDDARRWQWNRDPFGSLPVDENPDAIGVFAYDLRFPGQLFDGQAGLHQNHFRDYSPAIGRYVESDALGLSGGVNTYGYVAANPIAFADPQGLDIAVIENGPTAGNPFGHTAIAVTGAGVFSFGNSTKSGSSLHDFLRIQAPDRDTTVYIIKTSIAQDAAALAYLRSYRDSTLTGGAFRSFFVDNCSTRSNRALDAASISTFPEDFLGGPSVMNMPGTSGMRAQQSGAQGYFIARGATAFPSQLRQFEHRQ